MTSAAQEERTTLARPLLTHELGSLAKPNWRVKAFAGAPLGDRDFEEAREWGARLGVPNYQELIELLKDAPLDRAQKDEVRRWSSRYGVRFLESVGLDVVSKSYLLIDVETLRAERVET